MAQRYRIAFPEMPEESPGPFVSAKAVPAGTHRLRLVQFRRGFEEADWCRAVHTGYVLEGRLRIVIPGQEVVVPSGDGLHIPPGEAHCHKATPLTERAVLVLFEPIP